MLWVAGWAVVAAVSVSAEAAGLDGRSLAGFPDPVQRYLTKAVSSRERAVRTVRLRHGGTFRPSLDGSWSPIRGEQYFTAHPPGFIWWGRVRMFPGLWIDARDRSVNGIGNMLVTMESTFTIVDSRGPQLDQGALMRLLGEMTWLPTAFLDGRYVQWIALDEHRATATLQVNDRSATAVFEFGPDGMPVTFSADRYRDSGGGKAVMTPWVGRFSDYRAVDGVLVPHRIVAAWVVDGTPIEYVRFDVQQVEFDADAPF